MKRPTVNQTHAICDSLKARAVIVLAFGQDGQLAGASYGETKLECRQTGYTLDWIIKALEDGRIPVWATAESEKLRLEAIAKRDLKSSTRFIVRQSIEDGSYCAVCKVPRSDCDCDDRVTVAQYDEGSDDF